MFFDSSIFYLDILPIRFPVYSSSAIVVLLNVSVAWSEMRSGFGVCGVAVLIRD